jgi:hypothetical protein
MRGILADIDVGKQRRAILGIWASDTWRDLWKDLELSISNPNRVLRERLYAELVAERLLEKLVAIDDFCGAGRLYVP